MLKNIIRVCVALATVVLIALCALQLTEREEYLPLGSNTRVVLNFTQSGMSPKDGFNSLGNIAKSSGAKIYLLSPGTDDRTLNLYTFGTDQPDKPVTLNWFDPTRSGSLYPGAAVGTASPSGAYALKATPAQLTTVKTKLADKNIAAAWDGTIGLTVFFRPLIYQGAALTLVGVTVLLTLLITAWYAARAENRAIRVLAGTTSGRIQLDDARALFATVIPTVVLVLLGSLTMVGIWRGISNANKLLVPGLIALAIMLVCIALLGALLSILTWPRTSSYAQRRPPVVRFEFVNQLLKGLAFTFTLAAIPGLVGSVQLAHDTAAAANQARALQQWVETNVGGMTAPEYDKIALRVGEAIAKVDQAGQTIFNLGFESKDTQSYQGYGGLIIADTKYITLTNNTGNLQPLEWQKLPNELQKIVKSNLLQTKKPVNSLVKVYQTNGKPILAKLSGGRDFVLFNNPLVIVIPSASAGYDYDSLASYITTGNVLFSDPTVIATQIEALGAVPSFTRAADAAILYAQAKATQLYILIATCILLASALITALVTSAAIYAVRNQKRLYPRYLAGESLVELLAKRMMLEASMFLGVLIVLIGLATYFRVQVELYWPVIVVLGIVMASWVIHTVALRQAMKARTMRRS